MSLIPHVVWLGLSIERRYDRIAHIADGTLEAAVIAVWFGSPGQALEWLEQGRSIIWNQLLQLRNPLDELQRVDPPLAEELMLVANELQDAAALKPAATDIVPGQVRREYDSQRHHRLAERWEWLVHRAQSLPGMSELLAPKTAPQLIMAAQTRTIVVVIVTTFDCLALVVGQKATEVVFVNLSSFSYDKALRGRERLLRQSRSVARVDRKITRERKVDDGTVLDMLWTDIAKPVLDFLGYTVALPINELPHITWCTTGPLSFLPLHAAGDYTKPKSALSDYCISSYTPTLAALLVPPAEPATFAGIATIGQTSTPGFSPLPGTTVELDKISHRTKCVQITRLEGQGATCKTVLDAMERHSWVHLACHASQNAADPVASAFHLHDGPLDLTTIAQKHIKHADLAFLSACQTATGDQVLSEEAVHLAAGMIMAGYRTVIATMWPIQDGDAPHVADWFYEYMLQGGVPDASKAARALHYAVDRLRNKVGLGAYRQWAPYIHIGI
ncbi:hypothetical protein FRC06_003214 [Ceratobasidium sp. 370]|nr:hypothetical protein FRC06_003214 [Ceratobasidium sp. 370]